MGDVFFVVSGADDGDGLVRDFFYGLSGFGEEVFDEFDRCMGGEGADEFFAGVAMACVGAEVEMSCGIFSDGGDGGVEF